MEDFDLDGDLFLANGHVYPDVGRYDSGTAYRQEPQLLLNSGEGRFAPWPACAGSVFASPIAGRSAAADFDQGGDMDLVVIRDREPPLLLRNDLPRAGAHWIRLRLDGRSPNRSGIGARVMLQAGGKLQVREMRAQRGYLGSSEPVLVFGLGASTQADYIRVRWPRGKIQTVQDVPANREVRLQEP